MTPRHWLLAILAGAALSAGGAADATGAVWLGWLFTGIAIVIAFCAGALWDQAAGPDERDERRARIGPEDT